jgi:hypothetical protein
MGSRLKLNIYYENQDENIDLGKDKERISQQSISWATQKSW